MRVHLAYENIDADLYLYPMHRREKRKFQTITGDYAIKQRYLIYDLEKLPEKLLEDKEFFTKIRDSDIDVDMELTGRYIQKTKGITVKDDYTPVYNYMMYDILILPDGSVKERVHEHARGNIMQEIPVRINGEELYDPKELMLSYVFRKNLIIKHTNGLTFKFLFDIAKRLSELKKFARVDTYDPSSKKRAPLVLYDGGRKFPRAFLEGRVKGTSYCLILHLADQELILPEEDMQEEADNEN